MENIILPRIKHSIEYEEYDVKSFLSRKRKKSVSYVIKENDTSFNSLYNQLLKESGIQINNLEQFILLIHSFFLKKDYFVCPEGRLLNSDWNYTTEYYKFTYHYLIEKTLTKIKKSTNNKKLYFPSEDETNTTHVIDLLIYFDESNLILKYERINNTTLQDKCSLESLRKINLSKINESKINKILNNLLDKFIIQIVKSLPKIEVEQKIIKVTNNINTKFLPLKHNYYKIIPEINELDDKNYDEYDNYEEYDDYDEYDE